MANGKPITDFSKGIQSHPAFEGSFEGAADMLNWEIDEIGRPKLRKGYQASNAFVRGEGEQVVVIHSQGDEIRPPYSRIFRLALDERWVYDRDRLFIVGGDQSPRWIDTFQNVEHEWTIAPPEGGIISVDPQPADARDPDDNSQRIETFVVFYTWASSRFGIESPPSKGEPLVLTTNSLVKGEDSVWVNIEYDTSNPPEWADKLRVYITPLPLGAEDYRSVVDIESDTLTKGPSTVPVSLRGSTDLDDFGQPAPVEIVATEFNMLDLIQAGYRFNLIDELSTRLPNPHTRSHQLQLLYNTEIDEDGDEVFAVQISNETLGRHFNEALVFDDPAPNRFANITVHAGRIWGYDPDSNTIRYSLVIGDQAAFDIFPDTNTELPHAIRLAENLQSPVTHIHPISQKGGLYVFFSSAIRTITGRAVLTGLFSPESPPQTGLDASGGFDGIGTLSPRSVVSFRESVLFLGSDKTIYQLTPQALPQDLGLNVQLLLDSIPEGDLGEVFAFGYNDLYHLSIPRWGVLRYDTKRKYWTRFDWFLKSAFWSRGGSENESILYGVWKDGQLVTLYDGDTDDGNQIEWEYHTHEWATPMIMPLHQVFVKVSGQSYPMHIAVRESGRDVGIGEDWTPTQYNRFRFGFYGRGNLFSVSLYGFDNVPRIQSISFTE